MNTTKTDSSSNPPPGSPDTLSQNDPHANLPLEAKLEAILNELEAANANHDQAHQSRRPKAGEDKREQFSLPDDPFLWIGLRVRRQRDGAIFTVRSVFKNQRVELEKRWMSYSSDVPTIRSDFERCI